MNIKKIGIILSFVFMFLLSTSSALAHVTVKPGEVGAGSRQNFVVSVPTEEDTPTVMVRLVVPEGLQSVRPNAKAGWNIQLKKVGEGEEARISEIIWSGGRIPAEQRDEFVFSAQAPAEATTLVWKAYQTYGDGDVVSWENDPKIVEEYTKNNPPMSGHEDDHGAPRPYSTTKVVNDLTSTSVDGTQVEKGSDKSTKTFALVAFVLSVVSLGMQFRKK